VYRSTKTRFQVASADQTLRNIKAISGLEHEALQRRSRIEWVSDLVVSHAGRLWFLVFHVIWFAGWVLWNAAGAHIRRFDPFPYPALTTAVSLESIFLSIFILMSQNRSNRRADDRSHLDLQINLLAEREATKMLQLLKALCAHHHLREASDPEVDELLQQTDPATLAKELERELSTDIQAEASSATTVPPDELNTGESGLPLA
jgi:uncharacterized membrane protein